jgi:hypothetical protein
MWVTSLENHGLGSFKARLREGAVAWLQEQAAQAIDKAFGVSKGELLLESALWPNEEAQKTYNSASGLVATGDAAGALRHAPAYVSTFKHVTISAQMPATHNAPHMDACEQGEGRIINPMPGFKHHPPTQPVDVTSSILLNYGEDVNLLDRRGGQHHESCKGAGGQRYGSCEEDSGFGDCSGDNTSNGRVSPETSEELPTRRLPVRLPTRGPSVERPAGRKPSKRKAKPKISPADTGGRGADLVSADTPTDLAAQVGLSTKPADTPVAYLSQADESTMSADTPTDLAAQVSLSAKSADAPVACLPQADGSAGMADTPEDVPAAPEDMPTPLEGRADATEDVPAAPDEVTGTPEEATGMADTSGNMADFSDSMADTAGNLADSPGDRQAGIGLPLSALQAGAEEETRVKEDAATITRRQAAPSDSAAVASPPSFSTTPGGDSVIGTVVAAWGAAVPTGGTAPEDKWPKDEWLEDKMEKQLEEKERQLRYNMEKQLEEKEKQLKDKMEKQLEEKERQLRYEIEEQLKEEQKLFKYKEEKKKRIQDKREEWWTGSRSMTPPPRYSRSSRIRSSSQE